MITIKKWVTHQVEKINFAQDKIQIHEWIYFDRTEQKCSNLVTLIQQQ